MREAVKEALGGGLAAQSWKQITNVFEEMGMLREKFVTEGLPAPNEGTLDQARDRAKAIIEDIFTQFDDIVADTMVHVCQHKEEFLEYKASAAKTITDKIENTDTQIEAKIEKTDEKMEALAQDNARRNKEMREDMATRDSQLKELISKLTTTTSLGRAD